MSRILVIDDDSGNRLIVKSRLSDLGFEVLPVENGAQGLVTSREAGLDLVLVASGLGSGIDAVEGDEVTLSTMDPMKPAVLRGVGHDDYLYLLMPVRVP